MQTSVTLTVHSNKSHVTQQSIDASYSYYSHLHVVTGEPFLTVQSGFELFLLLIQICEPLQSTVDVSHSYILLSTH